MMDDGDGMAQDILEVLRSWTVMAVCSVVRGFHVIENIMKSLLFRSFLVVLNFDSFSIFSKCQENQSFASENGWSTVGLPWQGMRFLTGFSWQDASEVCLDVKSSKV